MAPEGKEPSQPSLLPLLTPTRLFWVQKLTYYFFIDVLHGLVVPLSVTTPHHR